MEQPGFGKLAAFIPPLLTIVFAGAVLTFLVISVILNYHWKRYEVDRTTLLRTRIVYFGVGFLIIFVMFTYYTRATA